LVSFPGKGVVPQRATLIGQIKYHSVEQGFSLAKNLHLLSDYELFGLFA
jgi:hypothetical protein